MSTTAPSDRNASANTTMGALGAFLVRLGGKLDGRRASGIHSEDGSSAVGSNEAGANSASSAERVSSAASRLAAGAFPGPWAFFTSAYMLGLLGLAILMHRIQHVVTPPRNRRSGNAATWRLALHLPTLYLLGRMLMIWVELLLDMEETSVASQPMSTIAWRTFCSVCAAFCVEGFVKAADGGHIAGHMQANSSPFNLVGYAFLLHIYSSPLTHTVTRDEPLPSRPDKHVMFTIAVPLLQLTLLHLLSAHRRTASHRLVPTMLASMLSLGHFWGVILTRWGSGRYPLLNYIPNLFESLLIATTLLTLVLRLLAGQAPLPLNMKGEEDFGVLLLRIGTASLEAGKGKGWDCELGGIKIAPRGFATEIRNVGAEPHRNEWVEYGRMVRAWFKALSRVGEKTVEEPETVVEVDSDAEYQPSESDSSSDSEEEDVEVDDISTAGALYTDMAGAGETLLAHMAHEGVVTRSSIPSEVVLAPRPVLPLNFHPSMEAPPPCVICTASPRDIIAWPCRCLALCDSCRGELAARSEKSFVAALVGAKGEDRCPCCRGVVEGYSRVYVP